MIDIHRGDDRHLGFGDVGGVKAAAHAHLQDGEVHSHAGKVQKGCGGQGLKETRPVRQLLLGEQAPGDLPHFRKAARKIVIGNLLAVHSNPLVDAQEVR